MTNKESGERRAKIRDRLKKESDSGNISPEVIAKIAADFNCTVSLVYQCMPFSTLYPRDISMKTYKIIADLQDPSLTIGQIAKKHDVHKNWISKVYIQSTNAGIKLPKRVPNTRKPANENGATSKEQQ